MTCPVHSSRNWTHPSRVSELHHSIVSMIFFIIPLNRQLLNTFEMVIEYNQYERGYQPSPIIPFQRHFHISSLLRSRILASSRISVDKTVDFLHVCQLISTKDTLDSIKKPIGRRCWINTESA